MLNKLKELINNTESIGDSQEFGLSYCQFENFFIEVKELVNSTEYENRVYTLPCNVGDTVWLTKWWNANCELHNLAKAESRKVKYFSIIENELLVHFKDGAWDVSAFGKFIFLSKEEADNALAMKGGNE